MVAFYADYDAQCNREGVVDFAELLLRTFETLAKNLNILHALPEPLPLHPGRRVPGHQQAAVQVDQDARRHQRCVFAVGDDDQCLTAGTLVTMADGSRKPIESVSEGDRVMSCYGSGISGRRP
jgi:DNA helicase-2/ATP-dependent DNA helicase PcrA